MSKILSTDQPTILMVAYRTRALPDVQLDLSSLAPPANYKSEDAIARWREEQAAKATAATAHSPYTATFDEVWLSCSKDESAKQFRYRAPDSGRVSVELAIKSYLDNVKRFPPGTWANTLVPVRQGPPTAIIVGFEPRRFLKILGIALSLPHAELDGATTPLPLGLWMGNTDHRDIEELVRPAQDCGNFVTWAMVLKARGLAEKYADWNGPGHKPLQDLYLANELAGQLGLMLPPITNLEEEPDELEQPEKTK